MFTPRTFVLLGALIAIGLGYAGYRAVSGGWFSNAPIQITARLEDPVGPPRRRLGASPAPAVKTVIFGMDGKYQLTSIRVEPVVTDEAATVESEPGVFIVPDTGPVWHVVAENPGDGSDRVQRFSYGQRLGGMKSAIEEQRWAGRLQPDKPYRIVVEAGKRRGELQFQTTLHR